MEERKLNFNAPLLSVRRFSAEVASSKGEKGYTTRNAVLRRWHSLGSNKSDASLDQVTEPVTVPFMWEHIPGKAKGSTVPESKSFDEPSATPRLPPGRCLDVIKYSEEKEVENIDAIRSQVVACSANENCSCDLEKDEDDYSDALDTISPTESLSWNCSTSGLSGSGDVVVKPSGSFLADPHTRDFMMGRFLPAAKAMALEPPLYASKKQTLPIEQPRETRQAVSGDRKSCINLYKSRIPHYDRELDEETELEDDDYNASGNVSIKGCGLFPRLCLKNSFYLLNPIPGLKVRNHSSVSLLSQVGKPPRSQSVKKNAWNASYKPKIDGRAQSPKLHKIVNKLSLAPRQFHQQQKLDGGIQSPKPPKIENKLASVSSDQHMSRSSPSCRIHGGSRISPYRRERPQSPFCGGGFLGIPKGAENSKATMSNEHDRIGNKSQELSSHQSFNQGSGSANPAVEKTLFVDTVNFAELSSFHSNASDSKGSMENAGKSSKALLGSRVVEEIATAESPLEEIKCFSILDEKQSSFDDMHNIRDQTEMMRCLKRDGGVESLKCIRVSMRESLNPGTENDLKADDQGDCKGGPDPPPLPKTPSESWLRRTLPSVTSKNPFMRTYTCTRLRSKVEEPQSASITAKWETIVKTSYLHLDRVRYSEELVTHVSQQPMT